MTTRRKAKAAGSRRALALVGLLAGACSSKPQAGPEPQAQAEVDVHADARERLAAYEQRRREAAEFAAIPASDGRFGADPYQLIAQPDGRVAAVLRGSDSLVLRGVDGSPITSAATVHDPRDLAWRDGELLVVGTGAPVIARFAAAGSELVRRPDVPLERAFAPRAIAVGPAGLVAVADTGGRLHLLRGDADELRPVADVDDHCRGPTALAFDGDRLLANCLLDHRVRVDRVVGDALVELGAITHDGPIWSFALGPERDGERLLALTGVEDHPLDRSDGGFGYIDSFLFIYALADDGSPSARRAAINLSELGVVTPKWSLWGEGPSLTLAGFATAELLELRFDAGFASPPSVARRDALPGTTAAVALPGDGLLAANPLLDGWLVVRPGQPPSLIPEPDPRDDRSFAERLGEALLFTTAMAPNNVATGQRSRFTCETCHFEGGGDGRVHYTGRERDGQRVHATSKPLFGLFPNRPYFSRALDRTMAQMVDNEFRVANRHSGRDPWSPLRGAALPWLAQLEGWPGEVDGEQQRLAVMAFLERFSAPSNPAVRGRERFAELERAGADLFAELCEGCHQARLVADDPSTRVDPSEWERLIFAANGPILWASADYAATDIVPYVHEQGARVPALRRAYSKHPYFTNGSAGSLAELSIVTHGAGSPATQQLDAGARAALAAFLRLL